MSPHSSEQVRHPDRDAGLPGRRPARLLHTAPRHPGHVPFLAVPSRGGCSVHPLHVPEGLLQSSQNNRCPLAWVFGNKQEARSRRPGAASCRDRAGSRRAAEPRARAHGSTDPSSKATETAPGSTWSGRAAGSPLSSCIVYRMCVHCVKHTTHVLSSLSLSLSLL